MKTAPAIPENTHEKITVTVGAKGFQAEVIAGNHTFIIDEPKSIGGQDTGPNPQDLILSALGSCTAITLRMYADRKAWPVTKIEVVLDYEEGGIAAQEFEKCAAETKRKITGEVLVHGSLTPEQVQRLDDIAHKCPVHKALSPAFEITLETTLAAPEFQ